MPAPSVSGRILLPRAARPPSSISTTGQTCTHTWFMSSFAPAAPRATRARRIASRQLSTARSACGKRGDPPVLVADHGELAHLGQRHQPPVRGVLPGDALVEQHVLGRLDPGHVEVAEPPQVQASADHRVDPPGEVVLGHAAVVGGPEGVVADRPAGTGADGDGDPAYVAGERQRLDQRAEPLARLVRRLRRVGPVQVEVDDGLLALATSRDVGADRGGQPTRRRRPARPRCRRSTPGGWAGRRGCSRRPRTGRSPDSIASRSWRSYSR